MWTPEPLTRDQIEHRSNSLLIDPLIHQVGKNYLIENGLRFSELYERVVLPRFRIRVEENADLSGMCNGRGALGAYFPETNLVQLDHCMSSAQSDPRRVFTLYHEVCGHGVLQGRWLRAQLAFPGRTRVLEDDDCTISLRNTDHLERQANAMAGITAAPMWLVDAQLIVRLRPKKIFRYIGPNRYQFGSGRYLRTFNVVSFDDYARSLAFMIAPWFHGLSVEALGYRVRRSRLVNDWSRPLALARAI